MRGDIDSMALHATCLAEMNDPREISLGLNFIYELVQGLNGPCRWLRDAADHARLPQNQQAAYAFCTAKSVSDLPCWIAYADHGRGIAIGLKSSSLQLDYGLAALPVCYDKDKFRDLLDETLPVVDRAFARFDEFSDPHLISPTPWEQAIRVLTLIAACFKSDTYAHEKEVRFVFWPNHTPLEVRTDLSVNLADPLCQASPFAARRFFSPSSSAQMRRLLPTAAIKTFLATRGGQGVHVAQSDLQYRA